MAKPQTDLKMYLDTIIHQMSWKLDNFLKQLCEEKQMSWWVGKGENWSKHKMHRIEAQSSLKLMNNVSKHSKGHFNIIGAANR